MGMAMTHFAFTAFLVLNLVVVILMVPSCAQVPVADVKKSMRGIPRSNVTLKERYYMKRCPHAERIVAEHVNGLFVNDPIVVANFIRLLFHDCFVNGCDASLLLDSTESEGKVEKFSKTNGELLQGVQYIDDIKMKLEAACPETVSCADILSFAAMEAMALLGGPRHPYLGGRRDGTVSLASQVDLDHNVPLPAWTMDQMIQLFQRKGFSVEDLVVLSGAHSVGVVHCSVFKDRLIGYASGVPDPKLSNQLVMEMAKKCKQPGTTEARANPTVSFDETPTVLDNLFFRNLVEQKKALLASDQNLLDDPRTSPYVHQFAKDEQLFKNKFADSLVRMSSLDVLVGKSKGEIRRTCRSIN